MKTRKRSQRENSQTSSNLPDSKRRNCKILPIQNMKNISQKKEMNDKEWELHDDTLLTQLGDVHQNVDTTMGTRYNEEFYRSFAAKLSRDTNLPITASDVANRVVTLRNIFHSYRDGTGMYNHSLIESDRFRYLLRKCFYQEIRPIQVPRSLTRQRSTSGLRRSTSGRSGSSQSVHQAPSYHVGESQIFEVLAHLYSQHQGRFTVDKLTLFSRYLDHNPIAAGVFLHLPGHDDQLSFIDSVSLDTYKDPWPRNQ